MFKKMMVMGAVCALLSVSVAPLAMAQTSASGPTGSATATVPYMLEFSLSLVKKMDSAKGETNPWTQGVEVNPPSFDFGQLQPLYDSTGKFLYMKGQYYYYVLLLAATAGRRYKITETGTQLQGPNGTLARESVLLIPDYQWLDELGDTAQGAPPSGAYLGSVTSATPVSESLVYQSDTGGESRIVRALVAITGPAQGAQYPANYTLGYNGSTGQGSQQFYTQWKPVTQTQKGGNYSGSVTFTLVLN
jgi:hypothetical protein